MIPKQYIEVKWNSKNKSHYESLGYNYTHMGDSFLVSPHDLPCGSNVRVKVTCDYCGKEFSIVWDSYMRLKRKDNKSDCCNDPQCTSLKSQESLWRKYHVKNARYIDGVSQKIEQTCLKKYGVKNPFQNESIKEKIAQSNLERYGHRSSMQNPDVQDKMQKTILERYGVSHYAQTEIFRKKFSGENNHAWKGGVSKERTERSSPEYRDWRKSIYQRDHYQCQCCGARSSKGHTVELHSHHIFNWMDNVDERYSVDNGITLCSECHYLFHSLYGKRHNTPQQLNEFLQMKRYAELAENELQDSQDKKPVS